MESLEAFYKRKFDFVPEHLRSGIGHFNVFKLDSFVGEKAKPAPYKRRDFYKIMLVYGNAKVNYADKVVAVEKQVLSFSNPQIPYKWENLEAIQGGYFCIFNQYFFHQYGNLTQYAVFQPSGEHIFELTDEQATQVEVIYKQMFQEINSDYLHKYDVLRNLVFELLHFAMKIQPVNKLEIPRFSNAAQRIVALFVELLERQFPIEENHPKVNLRTASDFATQLNIHVNHLNRAVKTVTQKTTSQLIAERILQESKILLRHSNWNVAEIAYSLGFTEVTHFNNFFKKHTTQTPKKFRNV